MSTNATTPIMSDDDIIESVEDVREGLEGVQLAALNSSTQLFAKALPR